MAELVNPLLPGFYPDPSICRVEDDFYMVTSTFSYFPGVPVFHSRDLRYWEQIGHVLDRPEQLPLDWQYISGGVYAPTIRWHDGLFYMITTNVSHGGNFFCTAKDPAGPWSDPSYVKGAPGIDPTLFWDDDGECYMMGTTDWQEQKPGVWIGKIDLENSCIVGERQLVWTGALVNAWAPEAPHVYKKDGWYYLMIAEGGTEHYHAVTIARSRNILGPYEGYRGNPILTHRHLGEDYPICNVGHADLVQLRDGNWYMVALASRIYGGYHKNLGRETFIAPVDWTGEWPVVSPGTGRVEWSYPAPNLPDSPVPEQDHNRFDALVWNTLGTPNDKDLRIDGNTLRLRCQAKKPLPEDEPDHRRPNGMLGFYGRRQQHMSFSAAVNATLPDVENAACGLMVLQNNFAQLRIELSRTASGVSLRAVKAWHDDAGNHTELLGETTHTGLSARLGITAEGQRYRLLCDGKTIGEALGGFLGSESCGGFVGAYVGPFATGNGTDMAQEATFTNFHYQAND
ncbi:MAG: glycoside hydrolase family 43 protein [Clostridiales bacterium]|nr:glycoside hydrolase family 43 protein [Clostridiales bacterium]